jgi:O-antigen ligase
MQTRLSAARSGAKVPARLVPVLAGSYALGIVALLASGRVVLSQAVLFLGAPVMLAIAVLRPEWTILILVALPPSLTTPIPAMQLVAILLATLLGFLVQGRLRLGPNTGIYPLLGIIALAIAVKAPMSAEASATADGMLKELIYFTLLVLVAFQTAASQRVRTDTLVNFLLLGIVAQTILQPFVGETGFEAITQTPFRGKFAYLAVMAFGMTYVRFSLRRSTHRRQYPFDAFLMVMFFCLTAIGFGRATWIAALLVFALVSRWTGRKAFWIVSALLLVLVLTVPVVGERVLPGGSVSISDVTLARVTTGRSELWGLLWKRGVEALPLGNGWGYTWTLTATQLFGIEGEFTSLGNQNIFPHNDFLFLFVELGILGSGMLVAFWLHLIHKIRLLSRSRTEHARYGVRVLVPVIVVMFLVQLFDNGFAIRFVAERFFIAAGLVFGMQYLRQTAPSALADAESLGTS